MLISRLDAVSIFNDKLYFLIPHEWIEVESKENDVYEYQLPNAKSGFFRVSLLTAHGPAEQLRKTFEDKHGSVEVNPVTGNFVARSEKTTTQDGTRIHIYYWFVAACVAANLIREAVFSYTILADLVEQSHNQSDIEIIGKLVAQAVLIVQHDDTADKSRYRSLTLPVTFQKCKSHRGSE